MRLALQLPRSLLASALAPAGLVGLAIAWQALAGFRISEEAGQSAEIIAWLLYAVAIILGCMRLGPKRALLAGLLALGLMVVAVDLNTRWATTLDVRYGGAYAWSGLRQVVSMYFIGPMAGLVVGILTGLLARYEAGRPQRPPEQ